MNSFAAFLAPLVLLLPAAAGELPQVPWAELEAAHAAPAPEIPASGLGEATLAPLRVLEAARRPPIQGQVRIEQRVIIRIAPSSERALQQSMARLAREADDFEEQRTDDCIPIGSIAGVYPSRENRLLLLMRDQRVLSASLERACNAVDYYAGFYVERSRDGQLCARRDRLQSRAGANCRVTRLNRLVAAKD